MLNHCDDVILNLDAKFKTPKLIKVFFLEESIDSSVFKEDESKVTVEDLVSLFCPQEMSINKSPTNDVCLNISFKISPLLINLFSLHIYGRSGTT